MGYISRSCSIGRGASFVQSGRAMRYALLVMLLGCETDLLEDLPDAALPDALTVPPIPGDYSCITTPWPMTAPDPLKVAGVVIGHNGVVVEVHAAASDALLAQATTAGNQTQTYTGVYSVEIPTGGDAPIIYRKYTPIDQDIYVYDATAAFDPALVLGFYDQSSSTLASYASTFGVTIDPAKGSVVLFISDCKTSYVGDGDGSVAGATVDAPPGSRVIYDASNPSATATTSFGSLLILNVPAGTLDLKIHAGPVTYRSWPVTVRANTWTYTERKP
jgi:hypothetical protein